MAWREDNRRVSNGEQYLMTVSAAQVRSRAIDCGPRPLFTSTRPKARLVCRRPRRRYSRARIGDIGAGAGGSSAKRWR